MQDADSGALLEQYAYDGNGNRTRALSVGLDAELGTNIGCPDASGTAANDQDQLCRYGDFKYRYNARGQLEERERVSNGALTQYRYDGLGRLKKVTTESGVEIHYVHDALGRRIGKVVDGQLERGWLYADALNPVAQLDADGDIEASFVYGTRGHVPDLMVMADGTVYRLITDHLGSVRLVVDVNTGTVMQRVDYDSFGRVLTDTNLGFQPFGFAGGLYDRETRLVRFGARDYDAYAGRWTAKDPILFAAGDPNLYKYVGNDPVNYVDYDGRSPVRNDTEEPIVVAGNAGSGQGQGTEQIQVTLNPGESIDANNPYPYNTPDGPLTDVDAVDMNRDGFADVGDPAEKISGTDYWPPSNIKPNGMSGGDICVGLTWPFPFPIIPWNRTY